MKKIITSLLMLAIILGVMVPAFAVNAGQNAFPSFTKFILDGKEVVFDSAYVIEESNYIQLRSVAEMLNGTKSQFNVYWDDAAKKAVIETGKPYTGVKAVVAEKTTYKVGETVTINNTNITIHKLFTTKEVPNEGGASIAADGTMFFGVTFTVLTANPLRAGETSFGPMHFLSCNGTVVENYRNFFQVAPDRDIYPNAAKTTTIYYVIHADDVIKSINFGDGLGAVKTLSI